MADVALNNALAGMSSSDFTSYANTNAAKVTETLTNNFANAFVPNLTSAFLASADYNALSDYTIQSKNLDTTVASVANNQTANVNTAKRNTDTASRVHEIKEWYYNNKLDTLFVYQLAFIGLCTLICIVLLVKQGILSSMTGLVGSGVVLLLLALFVKSMFYIGMAGFGTAILLSKTGLLSNLSFGVLLTIFGIILALVITNRALYTERQRDSRFWTKQRNAVPGSMLPGGTMPSQCAVSSAVASDLSSAYGSAVSGLSGAANALSADFSAGVAAAQAAAAAASAAVSTPAP